METPTVPHRPGTIYSDPTGKFITQSSQGNNYILVVFDTDSNYIFAEPMPSRTSNQILKAYDKIQSTLVARGMTPHLHIMDNEASESLKTYLKDNGIKFQLVPPNQHRANAAERAIRTFKNHFISTLCSCDPGFPLHLWDRLLDQTIITLNLLRTSTINNRLSAYAQIHGLFDFNSTPLGPPGTKVLIHERPSSRGTWAPHGTEGWYISPSMDHYRSYNIYIPSTKSMRVSDTLAWFPTQVVMPTASSSDIAFAAAHDLTQALLHPSPASVLSPISTSQRESLLQLATIFRDIVSNKDEQARVGGEDENEYGHPRVEMEDENEYGHPRVEIDSEPRVKDDDLPRINDEVELSVIEEELPRTSYQAYNHNGPQRRRESARRLRGPRHNRRHRNPVQIPLISPHSSPIDSPTDRPLNEPSSTTVRFDDNVTIIPDPPSIQTAECSSSRRSRRGTKVIRFDPKTHRIIPQHVMNSMIQTPMVFYANSASELKLPKLLEGTDAENWKKATIKEIGRIAQGMPDVVEGTNTLRFIHHKEKPVDRIASYCRIVCDYNEAKEDPYRIRFTYGGDRSDYPYDTSTSTVDTTTVKVHFNSIISTPGARHMTLDIRNFYLNTPLTRYEYMRIPVNIIPKEVMDHYNLYPLAHNGFIMTEIMKGIYGLPQAGILAKNLLEERLLEGGYYPAPNTPGLYLHKTRKISFTLWVDDFSIKYIDKTDVHHLITLLEKNYELKIDWNGNKYLGLSLHWNYAKGYVDISMPGYIKRALERFQHPTPSRPQHSPTLWNEPRFGPNSQLTPELVDSPPLHPSKIKMLQELVGVLLFYARMVDNTLLVAIGTIASTQSKATEETMNAVTHLLNYCATHPEAKIRYHASDMILHIVSDASYLTASGARSRLGGYFFMSHELPQTPPRPEDPLPANNGPILVNSSIIQPVVSSAAEAEFAALFYNAKDGCQLRNTLQDMGHPQPATPIQADNACAVGLANDTIKQRRSKAIDMRFYWVRDRVKQGQFVVYWKRGSDNKADYFTKNHPPSHHRKLRAEYLQVDEMDAFTSHK